MDQQLHAWFRYAAVLGIYSRHTSSTSPTVHGIQPIEANSKRRMCLVARHSRNFNLQRFYISTQLPLVLIFYVHGLIWRRRIPSAMLTWFVATILFTSQAIANFLIIYETLWKQQEHEAFLLLLQQISVSFKLRLRHDTDDRNFSTNLRRYLCYQLTLAFSGLSLFLLSTLWLQYVGYFWYGLWFMTTMRIRIIQLMIYLRVLHHYMDCLCVKLRQIVAYHTAPTRQLLDINYAKLQSHEYLLAIKEIYALLFEAFQLLNKFAGWSLLSIVTCYMLDISCNIYWTILSLEGYSSRHNFYLASLWWLLPMIAVVCHICRLCETCVQLDRSLAHLLSKIFIKSSTASLATYRRVLHQFTMQLQLQRIEVSAKHVFILDVHFLMSLATAIAAYLVILIQFLYS